MSKVFNLFLSASPITPISASALRHWRRSGESYNLAVVNGYGKLPKIDMTCEVTVRDKKVMGCYRLSDAYYNANKSIVEQQLKSGGVRLAGLLNFTYKS